MGTTHKETLSVFGLGKLGATMLACFAHKGWKVIGMDVSQRSVDTVNSGHSPIYEPGVEKLISANKARIEATAEPAYAVMNSDISFIIVPTPSIEDGSFTTVYVEEVVAEIGSILKGKDKYHLVVVTSTVLPGDMAHIGEFLEKTSGKKMGRDFGLCFNPDFIALGSIVRDFLNPDMLLIGESDKAAGDLLESIHRRLVDSKPSFHRMSFHNAELVKISINSFCTLKITFANTLAEICERMPGGDVDVVGAAVGADSRIGAKYLKGGLSFGGPCFPRDNRALANTARRLGCTTPLADMTDQLNNYHRKERLPMLLRRIMRHFRTDEISILGLTYKADTTLVEESAALYIAKAIAQAGKRVRLFDPAGMPSARKEFEDMIGEENLLFHDSAKDCLKGAKLAFIASPWKEFKALSKEDFISLMAPSPVVYDAWGLYKFHDDPAIKLLKIGRHFVL